jgi:hypothetical protein
MCSRAYQAGRIDGGGRECAERDYESSLRRRGMKLASGFPREAIAALRSALLRDLRSRPRSQIDAGDPRTAAHRVRMPLRRLASSRDTSP